MPNPVTRRPRKTRAEKIEELLAEIIDTYNEPAAIHTGRLDRKIITAEKYLNKHRHP